MNLSILGLGTALPEHCMSQDEAVAMSTDLVCTDRREERLTRAMFRRSKVNNRHTCVPHRIAYDWIVEGESSPGPTTQERMQLYEMHAGPLAIEASSRACDESAVDPQQISHLITVSCTGFAAPGVDVALMDALGLPNTVQRVNVGFMGCHGAINGLRTARGLAAASEGSHVLMCCVELCSLHFCFQWDDQRVLGNALFADGSAAVVATASEVSGMLCGIVDTSSCLVNDAKETITWHIGNHGYEMTLSNRVPELIRENVRPWLQDWLAAEGLSIDEIGSWAVHPGGPKIIDAVQEGLGLRDEDLQASRDTLNELGNMSSPTVLFILQRLLREKAPMPCVILGFGPGLVAEAALVR